MEATNTTKINGSARRATRHSAAEALVVNRNLSIEVSLDEILDDLLYPARRVAKK
jgi:hypothetical protein